MASEEHKQLITSCIELLDTFDPDSRAIDEHVSDFLTAQPDISDADETFLREVFSGCVRYRGVLGVVTNGFFNRDGKSLLQSEGNLYKVFAYLALFRLDELGIAHYRTFVKTQNINKLYMFLNFLFCDKNLRTWMKDSWGRLYEHTFVQTTLLSPILRWLPELQEMLQMMKKKIDNKIKPKKQPSSATTMEPFNLTQPRPRSVPLPQPIPKLHKHRPVPTDLFEEPKEQEFMAKVRETNRRKAEERLMQASKVQFACTNPEKSDKTKKKMRDIMLDQESQLDFNKRHAHPVPQAVLKDNVPVKLNAATILREGKLYKKREAEELKKLERLEAGSRDASDFLDWQTRMRRQDLDSQLADIERRRLEGKLSHEDAILARQNLITENRARVDSMKAEAAKLMQEYLEKRMEEEQDMRKLVENVMDTHENAKEAKKKLQQYKAKIVQEVTEESRELMRQALEEAEKEMAQRMELIQQIRAMEATPVIRQKLVDFTATAGHGLLSEMSIAELRERVSLYKISAQTEEDDRRDNILATKQAKEQLLMDELENISLHRTEQSKAAAIKLEERKKTHQSRPVVTDPRLQELQQKLDAKRAQRRDAQQKSRVTPTKQSSQRLRELNASKKLLEESRWQELEQRRQKTAKLSSDCYVSSPATCSANKISSRAALVS